MERQLRGKLDEWRQLLGRHVPQARQVLKKLLSGHILFTPHREGAERYYTISARLCLGKMLAGIACANMVASPTGTASGWQLPVKGFSFVGPSTAHLNDVWPSLAH